MRSIEDERCSNNCPTEEISDGSCISFEFHKKNKINRPSHHHRTPLGKPTPSKWCDAKKWLVRPPRGEENRQAKASPRNSNADDRSLIAPVPKKEYSSGDEDERENVCLSLNDANINPCIIETKNVDCDESIWRSNMAAANSSKSAVRSICLRDMGTDMTPIASKEPSRAATPVKATSPASSGSSTPVAVEATRSPTVEAGQAGGSTIDVGRDEEERDGVNVNEIKSDDQSRKMNPLEIRAAAWEEAERAKYMARYKREEVKIQAGENHEKRKAEMENRKVEVNAERLKYRAKEKYNRRIAAAGRVAKEKRVNAEAELNKKVMKTSERADYIKRTGRLPSSFSFKWPSCSCW